MARQLISGSAGAKYGNAIVCSEWRNKYIVVYEGRVIGARDNYADACSLAYHQCEQGAYKIKFVTGSPIYIE